MKYQKELLTGATLPAGVMVLPEALAVGVLRLYCVFGPVLAFLSYRPRPYAQTDAMVTYGFLDPAGVESAALSEGFVILYNARAKYMLGVSVLAHRFAAAFVAFVALLPALATRCNTRHIPQSKGGLVGGRDQGSLVEACLDKNDKMSACMCFVLVIASRELHDDTFATSGSRSCCSSLPTLNLGNLKVKHKTCGMP